MMMMMMNYFCGMVDQRKAVSLISNWDHCQRSSPSQISDTRRAGWYRLRKILENVFVNKKFTHCEISRTLQSDVIKIPDNKNIGKNISKNELLFLDQVNPNSDPSQILTLQFPIPRASLPPSVSLSYFILANWNPSSIQSSPCSSLVSLFCPT